MGSQSRLHLVTACSTPLRHATPARGARDARHAHAVDDADAPSPAHADEDDDALDAASAAQASPGMRLYHRWRLLFRKQRAGIGPQRRRAIETMLTVYPEDTLALAIDGAADDAWIRDRGAQFTSIEWILGTEQRVERFAEAGAALHAAITKRAEAAQRARDRASGDPHHTGEVDDDNVIVTPAASAMSAQARARLKALRDALAAKVRA